MRFDIVDVFAETRYAGNQLAIVRDAGPLAADEMQRIARETNFSETTFVTDDAPSPRVRIFTPRAEIPFAGHPTLGTAALLMGAGHAITLRLKVGDIPVRREGDIYWMRQQPASHTETRDPAALARVLGLRVDEIAGPCETISTGLPHLVVPLRDRDALLRVVVDHDAFHEFAAQGQAQSIACFARGAQDERNDLSARVFPIGYGIDEDPATGSAAGCLAHYLARHRVLGSARVDARLEQGAQIGRPSLLLLRADGDRIEVGGRVQHVVEGRLLR